MSFQENITIVIASDNHYAVLIAALIKSIEVHHKSDESISFIIIDDGISKKNKEKLQKSINPKITNLKWIESSTIIPPEIKIPTDNSTYPATVYYRLFAPYIVDTSCKKIIYMDVDMILYDDISTLYHINIGNDIVGAVQDYMGTVNSPIGGIPNYKELGIPPETKYFNSGLLLINPKLWKENDTTNKVINCMNDNAKYVVFPDQYGLNVVLYNRWHEIDLIWNCSDYFEVPSNPSLVHFLNIKPIFKSCFSLPKHKNEFYRLLSLTAFKNFKPISDYNRLFKKGFTKIKKIIYNKITLFSS